MARRSRARGGWCRRCTSRAGRRRDAVPAAGGETHHGAQNASNHWIPPGTPWILCFGEEIEHQRDDRVDGGELDTLEPVRPAVAGDDRPGQHAEEERDDRRPAEGELERPRRDEV